MNYESPYYNRSSNYPEEDGMKKNEKERMNPWRGLAEKFAFSSISEEDIEKLGFIFKEGKNLKDLKKAGSYPEGSKIPEDYNLEKFLDYVEESLKGIVEFVG